MQRRGVLGSGVPLLAYAGILLASVGLFLLWDGVLWYAPRESSHVGRFVASYLAVVPLAVVALAATGRLDWTNLATATGTTWGIKLVVTAVLYTWLAPGTAVALSPASSSGAVRHRVGYEPAVEVGPTGSVCGHVSRDRQPATAIVWLEDPRPGRPLPARPPIDLAVDDDRWGAEIGLAFVGDALRIRNRGTLLHTAHVRRSGRSVANTPVPPGATVRTREIVEAGLHEIRCDAHGEVSWLLVADSPYASVTDAGGAFRLQGAPIGPVTLAVTTVEGGLPRTDRRPVTVRAGASTEVEVNIR